MKKRIIYILMTICILNGALSGCKKTVEVNAPVTSLNGQNVYTTDATAIAAVTSIYTQMSASGPFAGGLNGISYLTGLSADEFNLWTGVTSSLSVNYYKNNLSASTNGFELWKAAYPWIFTCNAALEGLNASNSLTPAVKQQLIGEAEFSRAFLYFYLVNLYGDVPLVLTTDYVANSAMARTPRAKVYQQIITDLTDAENQLSANFRDATLLSTSTDRVRPSKWAAAALLARAYLYNGNLTSDASNYANAITQSSMLISNTGQFSLSTLSNAFLRASSGNNEAIWQLQPVATSPTNTMDGYLFIVPATGPTVASGTVNLHPDLLGAFESGDQRRTQWVGTATISGTTYNYPAKYKVNNTTATPVTEYPMILRLGEQYLIRAEAEAQQGQVISSVADLNAIRTRAGLSGYAGATDKNSLLAAILHERQVELFSEMGHRWLDLKRTGNVDAVMAPAATLKGATWNSNQQLFPLPVTDLQTDPNLLQNPGY